jgi:hypothetical protein
MKQENAVLKYAGLATQWMVMLGLGVWGGMKIDKALGLSLPVFLVLLPLIALIVSLYSLIKSLSKPKK